MTQNNLPEMKAEAAVALVKLFEQDQIAVTLDGGWGVDAPLDEQTRPHTDLDIVIPYGAMTGLKGLLEAMGYTDVLDPDGGECNF